MTKKSKSSKFVGRNARPRGTPSLSQYVSQSSRNNNVVSAQRTGSPTEIIQRTLPLFPPSVMKRLRYSSNFALASTAGAVASYVFAVNGLYDPDVTGTGHQPMGFDEMMIYFNHYVVSHCKVTAVAKCVSTSKMTVCMRQDASSTPITSIDRVVEIGGGVLEYLEISTTALATKKLELGFDIAKIQGISKSALTADSSLRGTSAANPTELTYCHIQNWDANAQTGTVVFDIILEFDAIFTEPRDGTSSLIERLDELRLSRLRSSSRYKCSSSYEDDHKCLCVAGACRPHSGHV